MTNIPKRMMGCLLLSVQRSFPLVAGLWEGAVCLTVDKNVKLTKEAQTVVRRAKIYMSATCG
jgi:hypothetical protein